MANPITVEWAANCDDCGELIATGEEMFFTDEGRLCVNCASENSYVCDCGRYKKPDFNQCYDCATL